MSTPEGAPAAVLSFLPVVLRRFLPDYLRLVEPDPAAHLCLDQDAVRDLPPEAQPLPGVLAEVPTRQGEKVTILVLVQAAALSSAATAALLVGWLRLFELGYTHPLLVSVLYLQGGRPGINLETVPVSKVLGLDAVRLYYTAFGLAGSAATYYFERPEPPAWALAALMGFDRGSRKDLRERCLARISTAETPALGPEDRALLARLVEATAEEATGDSEA
jgi:hypothetical protein